MGFIIISCSINRLGVFMAHGILGISCLGYSSRGAKSGKYIAKHAAVAGVESSIFSSLT